MKKSLFKGFPIIMLTLRIISMVSIITVSILTTGCTLIGYGVGKQVDYGNFKDGRRVEIAKMTPYELDWGSPKLIEVHKKDSTILIGSFKGYRTISIEQYRPKYNHFRDSVSANIKIPELEMPISILLKNRDYVINDVQFGGYTRNGIMISYKIGTKEINIDKFSKISDNQDTIYDLSVMLKMYDSNTLPSRSVIAIKTDLNKNQIPVDQIAYGICRRNYNTGNTGKWIGISIGMAIDITIGAIVITKIVNEFSISLP